MLHIWIPRYLLNNSLSTSKEIYVYYCDAVVLEEFKQNGFVNLLSQSANEQLKVLLVPDCLFVLLLAVWTLSILIALL